MNNVLLNGEWEISVKLKNSVLDQQVVIDGTENNQDGIYSHTDFGLKTLKGSFRIQIQYKKDGFWNDSLVSIGRISKSTGEIKVEIISDDDVGFGDFDFTDLILEAKQPIDNKDWNIRVGRHKLLDRYIYI